MLLHAGSGICLGAAKQISYILSYFLGCLVRFVTVTMVPGAMAELRIANHLASLVLALHRPSHSSKLAITEAALDF